MALARRFCSNALGGVSPATGWISRRFLARMPNLASRQLPSKSLGSAPSGRKTRIRFDWSTQTWLAHKTRPNIPGLIVYGRVDGSFAVWDPVRQAVAADDRPGVLKFRREEVLPEMFVGERRIPPIYALGRAKSLDAASPRGRKISPRRVLHQARSHMDVG